MESEVNKNYTSVQKIYIHTGLGAEWREAVWKGGGRGSEQECRALEAATHTRWSVVWGAGVWGILHVWGKCCMCDGDVMMLRCGVMSLIDVTDVWKV